MRIICGKFRGKRLWTLEGNKTRPTSDKVKESVFNILASRGGVGDRVLDLFAGSGALGIEALSRGATQVVFVDKNPSAVAVVKKNLASVGVHMPVYNTDWRVAVEKLNGRQFDLIFLDPPYALGVESELLAAIEAGGLLAEGGTVVLECASATQFDFDESYFEADKRVYSGTSVTFFSRKEGAAHEG